MISLPFLPDLDDPNTNLVRQGWDKLVNVPGGRWIFSRLIGNIAPYSGTIDAYVEELHMGHAMVSLEDRPGVRNHLSCVHAIALVNLAEIAGNVALSYTLPPDARFIVAGLSIEYLKKARGTIHAVGTCPEALTSERTEHVVPVILQNAAGEIVARVALRTLVGPKKKR